MNSNAGVSHKILSKFISKYFLLFTVILISVLFACIQPKFISLTNIMNIINTSSVVGLMAIGLTIVMSTGEINLAVGAEATLAAAVVGRLLADPAFNSYGLALALGLLATLFVGCLNSFFNVKVGVPSFIATIAMTTFVGGFIKLITNNTYLFSNNWPSCFSFLGQTRIGGIIPMPALIFAVISVVIIIIMDKTSFGRYIGSVGASPSTCLNVGINVKKIKAACFLICALLTGLDGIISSSMVLNVSPKLGGDVLMDAIAATMLGATFLRPGRYNIQGTIVAAFLLTVIQNGVVSIGAQNYIKDLVQGVILIIAVGTISLTRKGGLPSVSFNN